MANQTINKVQINGNPETYDVEDTQARQDILDLTQKTSQLKEDLTGLQTVVDSKADKTDLSKTNLYLDALFKLNKGQTYDVLEQESEAYSVDVPSGSKFMGVDMVGGKSIIFNQLIDTSEIQTQTINGITFTNNGDGSITANGTATADINLIIQDDVPIVNSMILMSGCPSGGSLETYRQRILNKSMIGMTSDIGNGIIDGGFNYDGMPYKVSLFVGNGITVSDLVFKPQIFDIKKQFGYTKKPLISNVISKYEEMGIDIVNHLHSYVDGVKSSQTDMVDVASADGAISKQITTGFPILNSAGSVYDYIDLNEGKLHQRVGVVDLGTLDWTSNATSRFSATLQQKAAIKSSYNDYTNIMCANYKSITLNQIYASNKGISTHPLLGINVCIYDSDYTDTGLLKSALSGQILHYELAEEIVTDIEIPTELTDWLTVETSDSITFHNADEGKRLLIPNKLSFVRKLDEVTV